LKIADLNMSSRPQQVQGKRYVIAHAEEAVVDLGAELGAQLGWEAVVMVEEGWTASKRSLLMEWKGGGGWVGLAIGLVLVWGPSKGGHP